jgi:hypothetical protein
MPLFKIHDLPATPGYPTYDTGDSLWYTFSGPSYYGGRIVFYCPSKSLWIARVMTAYGYTALSRSEVLGTPINVAGMGVYMPTNLCANGKEVYYCANAGITNPLYSWYYIRWPWLWYNGSNWVITTGAGAVTGDNRWQMEGYDSTAQVDESTEYPPTGPIVLGRWIGHYWFSSPELVGTYEPRGMDKNYREPVTATLADLNATDYTCSTLAGIYTNYATPSDTLRIGYRKMKDNHGGEYLEKGSAEGSFNNIPLQTSNTPSLYVIGGSISRGYTFELNSIQPLYMGSNVTARIQVTAVYPGNINPAYGSIRTFNITVPGTGYAVGDILTTYAGYVGRAQFVVTSVNGTGGITGLKFYSPAGCWEYYGTLPMESTSTPVVFSRYWSYTTADPTPYDLTVSFDSYVVEGADNYTPTYVTSKALLFYTNE